MHPSGEEDWDDEDFLFPLEDDAPTKFYGKDITEVWSYCDWCDWVIPAQLEMTPVHLRTSEGQFLQYVCPECLEGNRDNALQSFEKAVARRRKLLEEETQKKKAPAKKARKAKAAPKKKRSYRKK